MIEEVRNKLIELKDEEFKIFHSKLCPGIDNILGIRTPKLKKLACELKDRDILDYINSNNEIYYEEVMLKGFLIGYLKTDINDLFKVLENFIPKINNWAICDQTIANLKVLKKYKTETWKFIKPYLKSNDEFKARFGIIVMLSNFIDEEYVKEVLNTLDKIKLDKYYTKMAIAWTISVCYVKFKEITLDYLKNNTLDKWTYNKAIQKIRESRLVNIEEKEMLNNMKRK